MTVMAFHGLDYEGQMPAVAQGAEEPVEGAEDDLLTHAAALRLPLPGAISCTRAQRSARGMTTPAFHRCQVARLTPACSQKSLMRMPRSFSRPSISMMDCVNMSADLHIFSQSASTIMHTLAQCVARRVYARMRT